jgi:hypothetical protein
MPPLNQTLWMLLVALLCALAGWGIVRLAAPANRKQAKMREFDIPSPRKRKPNA